MRIPVKSDGPIDHARRRLLRATGVSLAAFACPFPLFARASAPAARSRLILLGTAGGPTPKADRSAPANAIVVDG